MSDQDSPSLSASTAAYWTARPDGRVACSLCHHACIIAPGRQGICRIREARGASLQLPWYGAISAMAIDPIEKKPLYHFLPGTSVFSAGFLGCNLYCPFCQNWEISQSNVARIERLAPSELVRAALDSGTPSIAYTYSEPLVHFEFVKESMILARAAGLRNILVTNGCVAAAPGKEILALTDAANIDLKCWSAKAYQEELGGDLETVLAFIRQATTSCHVEVTTLVVPGLSDKDTDIISIASFLALLSPDIPYHLSAYRPAWKQTDPATDPSILSALAESARSFLRYVYIGNVFGKGSDTICHACGKTVIARIAYRIDRSGIKESASGAVCAGCGRKLPIILD